MPRPHEWWVANLAPTVSALACGRIVGEEARLFLSQYGIDKEWGTTEFVNALYPDPRGDAGMAALKRLYRTLDHLNKADLADCTSRGAPRKIGRFGTGRPWLWHAPRTKTCQHCGKENP